MVTVYDNAGFRASRASSACVMMTIEDLRMKLLQSARSLLLLPLSQKLDCCGAIGGRGVTWRTLRASSVQMPGQESRAERCWRESHFMRTSVRMIKKWEQTIKKKKAKVSEEIFTE